MFRFICVECDDKGFPDWQALSLQENGQRVAGSYSPAAFLRYMEAFLAGGIPICRAGWAFILRGLPSAKGLAG